MTTDDKTKNAKCELRRDRSGWASMNRTASVPQAPLCVIAPVMGRRTETYIRRHAVELLPGRSAAIFSFAVDRGDRDWHIKGRCLVVNTPDTGLGRSIRALISISPKALRIADATRVAAFLRFHRVSAILCEYLQIATDYVELARALRIPFFAHAHGYDASAQLREPGWVDRYQALNRATGVIAVSHAMAHKLEAIGLKREKIHVIPCGIDVPDRVQHRAYRKRVVFVAVGRMVGKKGPVMLLDSFRRLLALVPDAELHYVGGGELLSAAHQFVAAFDLGNHVRLYGPQPQVIVQRLLAEADIFVQHSITDPVTGDEEGLPVSVLEAMAAGLPVVATQHAGLPEAVSDGETGFLVPEGDTQAMAERMRILANDGQLRLGFGVAAWQRAKQHFAWDAERTQLLRIMGLDGLTTIHCE